MFTRDGLFSFDGRIRRSDWWLGNLMVAFIALIVLVAFRLITSGRAAPFQNGIGLYIREAIQFILMAPFYWVIMALTVKRGHDLNIPAWPLLVFHAFVVCSDYLPFDLLFQSTDPAMVDHATFATTVIVVGGSLVELILLGFIRGSSGTNRYGPSTFAEEKPAFAEPGGLD